MSLAGTLWRENRDLARAALDCAFVSGLSDGTLGRESFRHYVAQDAFFLESFARAYALALAHSPDREGLVAFAGLIRGVVEELDLHAGYATEWGLDLRSVTPAPATLAYTDFLLATASLKDLGRTCAAMTPCMKLYSYLGRTLEGRGYKKDNPYRAWIEAYASPEFEALAENLEGLLDRYAEENSETGEAYRRAMELEVGFFRSAFEVGKGGV